MGERDISLNYEPLVLCRPAVPRDRVEVMDLLANIWQGEDYVPYLWDQWLYQDSGCLAVAESGGRIVGTGHLKQIVPEQWWLEGLRVHPELHGQGIGSKLHDYFVDRWLATGGEVVRLATHSHRKAVHAMCERTAFRQIAEVVPLTSEPTVQTDPAAQEKAAPDWQAATEVLATSECSQALTGLVDYGWKFAEASPAWLGAGRDDRLLIGPMGEYYAVRLDHEEQGLFLHALATSASVDELEAGLRALQGWAASQGAIELTWLAPKRASWVEAGLAAGFEVDERGSLVLYERRR